MKKAILSLTLGLIIGIIGEIYLIKNIFPFYNILGDIFLLGLAIFFYTLVFLFLLKKQKEDRKISQIKTNFKYEIKEIKKSLRALKVILKKVSFASIAFGVFCGAVYTKYVGDKFEDTVNLINEDIQNSGYITLQIVDILDVGENCTYIAKMQKTGKKVTLSTKQNIKLNYLENIRVNGTFYENETQRNTKLKNIKFNNYSDNLVGKILASKIEKIDEEGLEKTSGKKYKNIFSKNIYDIKFKILNFKFKDEDAKNVFCSLVLGNSLKDELSENISLMQISHMFSISGTHIYFLILILDKILYIPSFIRTHNLNTIKKCQNTKNILEIFLIFLYMKFLRFKPAILRAGGYLIYEKIGELLNKEQDRINGICISIILNILISPYRIINMSFILSYFAIISLNIYSKQFRYIQELKKISTKEKENKENKQSVYSFLKQGLTSTILVLILIFPIQIYYFNYINFNIFIYPIILSTPIIIGYSLNNILTIVNLAFLNIPYLNEKIFKSISFLNNTLVWIIKKIPKLELKINVYGYGIENIIKYYIILILAYLIFIQKNPSYLNKISTLKKKMKKRSRIDKENIERVNTNYLKSHLKRISSFSYLFKNLKQTTKKLILSLIVFTFVFSNYSAYILEIYEKNIFKLNFIDVGQGDCCLIRYNGKNILVDSGGSTTYDVAKNVLKPYFLKNNIKTIDHCYISHLDTDHCKAIIDCIKDMDIKNIYLPYQREISSNYLSLLNEVNEKNKKGSAKTKITYLTQTNILQIKNLTIETLFPLDNIELKENILNNNSLVLKFSIYGKTILFTGDIEKEAENMLLNKKGVNLKADILKVSHHGSKTSTTKEFLDKVKPQMCLIGVGKNNKFGHPTQEVLNMLENVSCKIFRTDLNGEIIISINKKGKIKVKTIIG